MGLRPPAGVVFIDRLASDSAALKTSPDAFACAIVLSVVVHIEPAGVFVVQGNGPIAPSDIFPSNVIPGNLDYRKARIDVPLHVSGLDAHAIAAVAVQVKFVAPDLGVAVIVVGEDGCLFRDAYG